MGYAGGRTRRTRSASLQLVLLQGDSSISHDVGKKTALPQPLRFSQGLKTLSHWVVQGSMDEVAAEKNQ
ncbi:hypothetical protein [Cupriavidus gilardii]|uniref:hypothetical protein n=1 Tax=Cupriavidus gilardii TaxID=82541 RepID=UPI0021C01780|nr:hypothetical protein [Cupriavidus gilardii]MCT9123788.1 hypothetical protein [Cupriavidus gilardii]